MPPFLSWLANNPAYTNLIAAVLNLIIAGIVYRWKLSSFQKRPFTKRVFQMWVGQWFAFVLIFIVLNIILRVSPTTEGHQWFLILLLCSAELQTMFALAGGWLMLRGNSKHATRDVLSSIGIILVCLWLWDISIGSLFANTHFLRELWIFPSRILAMFAFLLLSIALFLRNKQAGVPFLAITIAYATAQLPVYEGTFVSIRAVPNWFTALAVGKLLIALTFYPAFFTVRTSAPITFESLVSNRPSLFKYLQVPIIQKIAQFLFWVAVLAAEELIRRKVVSLIGYN
jgi:hypothetical protein